MHAGVRAAVMFQPVPYRFEAEVMERVWSYDHAVRAGELLCDLGERHELTETVLTRLLARLCRRGWLRRERVDGAYVYEAAVSRTAQVDRLLRDALTPTANPLPVFVLRLPATPGARLPTRCRPG